MARIIGPAKRRPYIDPSGSPRKEGAPIRLEDAIPTRQEITFVDRKLDLARKFIDTEKEVGKVIDLVSSKELQAYSLAQRDRIVDALYNGLGAKMPPEIDKKSPEFMEELELYRVYDYSNKGTPIPVRETNTTDITTRTQIRPTFAIVRSTTFIWANNNFVVESRKDNYKLIKTVRTPMRPRQQ